MGAAFCPNKSSQEYLELIDVFKDSGYVHKLYKLNNGHPLEFDHNGNPSILFEDLMAFTDGDREEAFKLKSTVFNDSFIDFFGKWYEGKFKPESHDVYENGEPFMDTFLDYTYASEQEKIHPDPKIRANIKVYGDLINDWNNQYVWDVEDEFNLVDKKKWHKRPGDQFKTKVLQGFSFNKALSIINKLKDRGYTAIPVDVFYPGEPNKKPRTGVRVKYDIGLPEKKGAGTFKNGTGNIVIAGQTYQVRYADIPVIKADLKRLATGDLNAVSFLTMLSNLHEARISRFPEVANSIKLILNNRKKLESVKVVVVETSNHPGEYMYYNPNNNTIEIHVDNILENPTLDGFISTFVHEVGHAFLYDALENPINEIDIQFKKTMTEVFNAYKKQPNLTNVSATKDVHEFLSIFMTDARLRSQLKEMSQQSYDNRSLFKRVLDAIIDWFKRSAGYKLRKEHEGNLNDFVERTLTDFFENKTEVRNPNRSNNQAKKTAAVKIDYLEDIRAHVDPENPKTIKTALSSFAKLFEQDPVAHKYYLKKDKTISFKSVTQINAEHGYGIKEEDITKLENGDEEQRERIKKMKVSANIGTAVHKSVEEIVTGVVQDIVGETGFIVSDDAKDIVKDLINDIKKHKTVNGIDPIILSEVVVADISKGIAGTIDMVVIDGHGRVHIYDFKTKRGGFKFYTSGYKGSKSDQEKYRLQLSAYKLLLEEVLGGKVRVSTMNVVQLVPIMHPTKKYIVSLSKDTQIYSNGIDSFYITPLALKNIYGASRGYSWDSAAQLSSLDSDILSTPGYKLNKIETAKLSSLQEVYKHTMKTLESKVEIMRRRYSFAKRRSFEDHFNKVSQMSDMNDAIREIVYEAAKITNTLVARYNQMELDNAIFTPAMLQEWRDYIMAYDSLDALQAFIDTTPSLNNPDVKDVLKKVLENKTKINNAYILRGKEAVAKRLVPYFDMIRVQRKEELESFWRRMNYRVENKVEFKEGEKIAGKTVTGIMTPEEFAKYGKTINEFVDYHLSKESNDIDKATYELLLKELSVASNDVNEAIRWVDALSDTTDPIAAAIVSAFSKADEASRLEAMKKQIEIYRVLTQVEKDYHKTGMTSERKFWDELLDVSENGCYLIRPFLSTLELAERDVRAKHRNDENQIQVSVWVNEHFKISKHEDAYLEAYNEFLIGEYKAKRITYHEHMILNDNEEEGKKFPISKLSQPQTDDETGEEIGPPLISIEAAEIAMNWKAVNRRLYSDIKEEWVNPKWNKFMNRLGIDTNLSHKEQFNLIAKSNDSMAKMYTLLVKTAEEGDSGIPYSHRLGYRLPGVRKNTNENLREGKDVAATFKERIQLDFIRKEGDVQYNPQEYTDEAGNPKYFLPVHYINKLDEKDQSFDLPTIYFKFWDSANDYANKRDILPTIEMAKHFVDTRFTEKRNSLGEKVLRSLKSTIPGFEDEAAVTKNSNLSKQLEDWFQMYVYGNTVEKTELKINDKVTLDVQKLVDGINQYTSVNLLALNVVQSIANVGIGESMQSIEAIAGEYISIKSYSKGAALYTKWLPGMLDDIGRRLPNSVGSLIIQQFNAMNEDLTGETEFANKNKMKALSKKSALMFMQQGGEHWLRARFLYGMLNHEIRAISKDGVDLGSMIDFYYVENGELKIRKEVDLVKSKWTEEDQQRWARRFRGIADRVHGAYSLEAKVAAQRYFVGKLAYMFRKFVVPGIRRRYGREAYSERLHQTLEGNYITTFKFFKKMHKEILGMKFALMGEEWAALSPHEQANIKRTISELATITSVIILANFAYTNWTDGEDESDKRFWAFMAYQTYRLKAEMLFYTSPGNAMQILRSPMASMSVLENIAKTWDQMFNPMERYERGPWKGHLKLERDVIQFIPIYKQYFRLRDNAEQIQWFR